MTEIDAKAAQIDVVSDPAAIVIVASSQTFGRAGEGLFGGFLRDGTGRPFIWCPTSKRIAILPWAALANLAVLAGVEAPPPEQRN